MKIYIDATNIKAGGGLTHLKRLLEYLDSPNFKIEIIGGDWLRQLPNRAWINLKIFSKEFSSLIRQEFFKWFKLKEICIQGDIIFSPGGTFYSKKKPYVSMSQNMLVFENEERNRFPKSVTWIRYLILERLQMRSFQNSSGMIYISEYAKSFIENKYPELKNKKSEVIYHGISDDFRAKPKKQLDIKLYSESHPFKLLYVSIINFYKHQWNVIAAVRRLRHEGFPIELDLIGPAYKPAMKKFQISMKGTEGYVNYLGQIPYSEISSSYKEADLFIFASTCENMPNILVEAMSAGLPILSSNYGPMPEILKDGGVYMDPIEIDSIYLNLKSLLLNPKIRTEVANRAYDYSREFSWQKTSEQTFKFIEDVYKDIDQKKIN